jgi:hypothetical protein
MRSKHADILLLPDRPILVCSTIRISKMSSSNSTGQGAHNDPDEELNQRLERTRIQAEQEADARFARDTQQALRATARAGLQRIDDEAPQLPRTIENSKKHYEGGADADFERQIQEATKHSMSDNPGNIEQEREDMLRAAEESLKDMRKREREQLQQAREQSLKAFRAPQAAAGQDDDFRENPNYMNNVAVLMADRSIQRALAQAPASERDALNQTLLSKAKSHQNARDIRTRQGGNPDDEGPFEPSLLQRGKRDKKHDKGRSSMRGGSSSCHSQGD